MKRLVLLLILALASLAWLLGRFDTAPASPASAMSAAPAVPATSAADPAEFVIRAARVFDGDRVWPRADVHIAAGRIVAIAESLELPPRTAVVEAEGRSLLPGLIDAHVHTWGEARRDALRFGVTTLLDQFSDPRQIAAARSERKSHAPTARADLWSAGRLATAAGGHGTQFGVEVPTLAHAGEAGDWVGARKAEGSDWIKIVREDLHTFDTARRLPTLDQATVAALIAAAHAQGLRAVVHASAREHARAALRDGADGLVHGFDDAIADDAFVALARERGAFVVATLTVVAGMGGERASVLHDARTAPWLDTAQRQTLAADFGFVHTDPARLQRARDTVRRLHAAGVPILAGSDAPNPNTAHGVALHEELAQLVRAGLTPRQALIAATSATARAFGLHDRGRIAPGLRADLLLVDGDPLADIEATRAIVAIWKNGTRVARTLPTDAAGGDVPRWTGGALGDFDAQQLAGAGAIGWNISTDRIAGGASQAHLAFVAPGADASAHALRITGETVGGAQWPWAGVMFTPGSTLMQAVDARALQEIVLQVRGDGREYTALLLSGDSRLPAMQSFVATPDWRQLRLPLSAFPGADLARLRGFGITAGLPHGRFALEIDAVDAR